VRRFILTDIDHVISNAFPRDHMIGGDWDDYHAASDNDVPIYDVSKMLAALRPNYRIIGITARPGKWRQLTLKWLYRHRVPMHELLMRADEDYRPSVEMKLALARERFGDNQGIRDNVSFLLEDREDVAAAFRDLGITVLQVFGRRG
jgi:hypothetical protein